jgi:Flp pilus assembly pilin Flp
MSTIKVETISNLAATSSVDVSEVVSKIQGTIKGQYSFTTDASGIATLVVNNIPSSITAIYPVLTYYHDTNDRFVKIDSISLASGTATIVFKVFKTDGSGVAATEVGNINYHL